MAELEEVEVEILNFQTKKYEARRAVLSQKASYNIVERTFLGGLQRPWTSSNLGIVPDLTDHASPPLGRYELRWCWKGCSATASAIFIVVEKIEGTTCGILLGPIGRQKPVVPPSNDAFAFTASKRTNGISSSLFYSWQRAYDRITEEQHEQRERMRLAALRRPFEKAQDEARIREGWEKKKREEHEAVRRPRLA